MKRLFAVLLAAAMVLSLAACGSGEPSISDALGTLPEEPAVQPEQTESPREQPEGKPAEEQAEKPSRIEKEPEPQEEPAVGEPEMLARRLEGNYTRPVETPNDPEHEDVQIRLIGDLISLEWGAALGTDQEKC